MSLLQPVDDPPTKLGVYRVLSSRAGVRVSPLSLGAMSIGDKWAAHGMGSMDKESSFELLDAYFDMGGNFIDTANTYQDQSSEEFIGEWAEKRGIRDQLVIATKYTTNYQRGNDTIAQKVNYVGNSTKSMYLSVDASLKKLRTTYIDILYVMDSLHNLVAAQKVLYLGISDTPAWVANGASWKRSFEREIIPMARSLGIALAPWGVLGQGKLRTDAEEERRKETGEKGRLVWGPSWERTEVEAEIGARSMTAVAIAYVMQKAPYVGRSEHLKANIEALDISLSKEQIEFLEGVVPFELGFPARMIGDGSSHNRFLESAAKMAKQPALQPIKP
ncbi:NADP-dependent oxidoreductase domain-containing protein [Armillaria mellea]|nr:NADP-dependent oxidoreductase domain-containing protein [Armillaria mellea]